MIKLTIDNQDIEVIEGTTVLQAAQQLDIEIPIFCYHPRLAIAGNCRMCLVEMENSPKPIASCAMPVSANMVIYTHTPMVEKARKGVLEFLLINHPLDCPICDQGGECDLQDITLTYGPSTSRFQENKRAVSDKYLGPLIRTSMNRCIHCTRCIRFASDIAGVQEMGAIGRGENVEITNYLSHAIISELSGNMVDVCPVGALTSKPYAFQVRPWDLVKTESIDVLDAIGSHIRVDTYGMKVSRILPRLHEDINEEWISDKTRHAFDGLAVQRLDQPYVRHEGKLQPASWSEAFKAIQQKLDGLKGKEIAALAGNLADVESMFVLKQVMTHLKSPHLDCRQDGAALSFQARAHYLFNSTIAGIEKADACLIIDSAVRQEAPLIQARLRKRYLAGHFKAAYIGGTLPKDRGFTFPIENLGDTPATLLEILTESHPFSEVLKKAKYPIIIIGQSALIRSDGAQLFTLANHIACQFKMIREDWCGLNILHTAAGRVGGLDIGFIPSSEGFSTSEILAKAQTGKIKFLYLLGVDEIETKKFGNAFVVYQGHHGDRGAHRADVILPGAAYTEKSATYVNTEGRVQQTSQALFPPGQAKEDWRIIQELSETIKGPLAYQNIREIRRSMAQANSVFNVLDEIIPLAEQDIETLNDLQTLENLDIASFSVPFMAHEFNFYMTDPISRSSPTMALCLKELAKSDEQVITYD